jgi:type II secretory pathway component PulF
MPLYRYDSLNRRGVRVAGTIDAPTMQAAKEVLQGQGLLPTSIEEMSVEGTGFSFMGLFERPVDPKMVIVFTKQLSVLLKSAVPLLQALELLVEQFDGKFRRIVINVKDGVKAGESFANQLSKYPKVFSNVYTQLVRAGEASGKLDIILLRLSEELERSEETRKRVKKAMAYPMFLLSFAVLIVIGLLTMLVPRLRSVFESTGKELPAMTQFLLSMSDFTIANLWTIVIVSIALGFAFAYWRKTPQGKYKLDQLCLRLPIISYFSRTKAVVQFSKTLGMLLESGVNLSEALDIVCNVVDNKLLTERLMLARDNIIKEGKIAKYLKETAIFPNIASYMISTGEQSGKLAQMLITVGQDYDAELQEIADGLTAKINPIMIVIIAGIVGFIIVSIFLPIMSMADVVQI